MVTDVKKLPIQFDRDSVVAFCRDRGIVRLSVFGSVLRDDFDPTRAKAYADCRMSSSSAALIFPGRTSRAHETISSTATT